MRFIFRIYQIDCIDHETMMVLLTPPTTMPLVYSILSILLLSRLAQATDEAYHDSNYFAANRINPNVKNKMYYAESSNVLASLANFDKLYVSFHNCV